MAPGDIQTQPGTKIVFNAPYDDKNTYHIKVIKGGCAASCLWARGMFKDSDDEFIPEWTNTPDGAGKQFRRGRWYDKNLPIEYNP